MPVVSENPRYDVQETDTRMATAKMTAFNLDTKCLKGVIDKSFGILGCPQEVAKPLFGSRTEKGL